jgi:hypothetical protein
MESDDPVLLKRENAQLRDQLARAQEEESATAGLNHPDFEGFREMSRALHEGRYHQWYVDKHMFLGAYKITVVVAVLGLVLVWGYLLFFGPVHDRETIARLQSEPVRTMSPGLDQ